MTLKNLLGQVRFGTQNLYFKLVASRSKIDYDLLDREIEKNNLKPVLSEIDRSIDQTINNFAKSENLNYFNQYKTYDNRDVLKRNPFPLFPPNVAVIDFLLKNVDKNSVIMDYACGFNNMSVILRHLGFGKSYGQDNFSQIKRETIESFLGKFNLISSLTSKSEALTLQTNVAMCICFYWNRLDREIIKKEIANPHLKYLILDIRYAPPIFIKGFRVKVVYDKLIVIYERQNF